MICFWDSSVIFNLIYESQFKNQGSREGVIKVGKVKGIKKLITRLNLFGQVWGFNEKSGVRI